jgi:hypothetical protein
MNDHHDTDGGTMMPISGSTTAATMTPSPNVTAEETKNDTVGGANDDVCDVDTMNSHATMMMVHNMDSAAAAAAAAAATVAPAAVAAFQDCAVETPLWVVPKKPLLQRLDNGRTKVVAKPLKIARNKKWSKAVGKVGFIVLHCLVYAHRYIYIY